MKLLYYALTHKGLVRSDNQDSFLIFTPENHALALQKGSIFLIADGAGGHQEGAIASRLAVETFRDYYYGINLPPEKALKEAIFQAHEQIVKIANQKKVYMATTLTALVIINHEAIVGHVGDSRLYLLREGDLHLITKDHTLVEKLIDQKVISREEALKHPQKHILTQALGVSEIKPLLKKFELRQFDIILLSTDGLHDYVSEKEIKTILSKYNPKEAAQKLIHLALEQGGYDNITTIIIHCLGEDTVPNKTSH